jgi:hypothetical protein
MSIKAKTSAEKIEGIPMDEIREALVNEYRRRKIRYKIVDEAMKKKYGMDYAEFESRNMVRERKFDWDVESDSMEWEHAIEGFRYVEQKLRDLEDL